MNINTSANAKTTTTTTHKRHSGPEPQGVPIQAEGTKTGFERCPPVALDEDRGGEHEVAWFGIERLKNIGVCALIVGEVGCWGWRRGGEDVGLVGVGEDMWGIEGALAGGVLLSSSMSAWSWPSSSNSISISLMTITFFFFFGLALLSFLFVGVDGGGGISCDGAAAVAAVAVTMEETGDLAAPNPGRL